MPQIRVNYYSMSHDVKNILIRGVNWIGDAVLTLPSIRAVRKAFPEARISLLVKPWVSEIFLNNPDIDEIILYEDTHKGIGGKLKLAGELRKKKFDAAILFQNAFDAALIARLAGVPERIGYSRDGRGLLLTKAIPLSKDILPMHQVYYYLNLLKAAGIETKEVRPFIWLTDEERQWARDVINSKFKIQNSKLLIGINPGATYGSAKRWPPERFAALIAGIINELDGSVIIVGSEAEAGIANEIVASVGAIHELPLHQTRNAKRETRVLNMAGKTNLRQLAALIAECDAFVTNDSGPMHIASALLVPVVAIFGSTDKTSTGPFGEGHKIITKDLPCSPCMKRECPDGDLRCMTEITVEDVFDALKAILPREKAVFLDRDGTVIEDKNYLNTFDNLVIFSDSRESMLKLKDTGFKLIGITNQSGIARGIIEEKFVIELNAHLQKELGIDAFYYCPHHPDERCPCRKPEPLMPLTARLRHKINMKASYMMGDKELDVKLAWKIGATGVLLSATPPEDTCASYVAKDLTDAVRWIVEREETP
ncbi:MAG: lipopolysaccharide heptosyltransferase II [Nitrospirae bacterium]|nr:lipopolysaccharide heptosyltransferase II [Nitrospirota bacterium]